ncbi:MAG TPA: bifunctional nuclease domain-containing protein [Candidatus Acidoferrales bacterium]|nr:bifunctional nuclease domain-containing protein [Candidatus Acidoferrales bacterium]
MLCLLLLAAVGTACACGRFPTRTAQESKIPSNEIKVQVARVGFDDETGAHYVLLQDDSGSRELPIMIGENETRAILLAMQGIKPERPLTHDLMRSIIGQTGNRVDRILIAELRDEVYYAKIFMDGGRVTIDSRPSDAIALAMGSSAPIYVNASLFAAASSGAVAGGGAGRVPETARALGITVEQMTPELASYFGDSDANGVLISAVDARAEKAGIARGDIVVRVNNREVKALDDFSRGASDAATGRAARLILIHGGARRVVTLEIPSGSASNAR